MKFSNSVLLSLSALIFSSSAAPAHSHNLHKRAVAIEYEYVTVTVNRDGETILATSQTTSTYKTAESKSKSESKSYYRSSASTTSYSSPSSSSTSSSSVSVASSTKKTSTSSPTGSTSIQSTFGDLSSFSGPSEKFEDGVVPCSDFPSGNGVIALTHVGSGGWSGIELIHSADDIEVGGECREGAYCSYACQPGMSKTQWPSEQPASGVSIGGLLCKNGYLYKTNSRSDYLCEWGVDSAYVVSELDDTVAICRTDYPGTENMVIPTIVTSNSKLPLTVVDQDSYYTWRGGSTSAQYYVNDAGVDWETGCSWGDYGTTYGNWAPLNFGAGASSGVSYLSLIPNPNNKNAANFNVEIVKYTSDAVISGECAYVDGVFNDGTDGCTVGVTKGSAKFRLYN
ncbi:putative glucosidase SUN4 [Ascoidea rubescens DSM 1968]|uniref:SUN-domain-containing protein n=1 Tax=Ascoidea rubescens DSM 1968 TaxID=1344418 RepID=A0A1D2VB43_9ASCO|nr:SUN-domain-containing protein [Ascoidea rubescens DSM 1968]ODV58888.1 SUN-domain-containing protein [Ascoidea rubescens DSM 1968]